MESCHAPSLSDLACWCLSCRCIIERRGHWQMNDYLHFVEAHSLYLFRGGVLSSRVREA